MKMDEIEEIRKYWIDPETKRAWDIFADSSKAFYAAKKDIPTLLSALEAAQEENKGLREAVKEYLAIHSEPDIPLEDAIEEARKNNGWLHRSLSALEKMEQALSRTEKEGGG